MTFEQCFRASPLYAHLLPAQVKTNAPGFSPSTSKMTADSVYPTLTPSGPGTAHKQQGRRNPEALYDARSSGVTRSPLSLTGLLTCKSYVSFVGRFANSPKPRTKVSRFAIKMQYIWLRRLVELSNPKKVAIYPSHV